MYEKKLNSRNSNNNNNNLTHGLSNEALVVGLETL